MAAQKKAQKPGSVGGCSTVAPASRQACLDKYVTALQTKAVGPKPAPGATCASRPPANR